MTCSRRQHLRSSTLWQLAAASVVAASLWSSAAQATQPVTGTGDWYYQIGGAAPISPAPNVRAITIQIDGGAGLRLPQACGSLDAALSVNNILDDIKNGIDRFEDAMVLAAQSAIAALPALILQRANPGLYEHFQNAVANANIAANIAVKSCQQMVDDGANGGNPFKDWVRISKTTSWGRQLDTPGNDPVSAQTAVEASNGDEGIPWIGGDAGGAGQEPIRVVYDTARAGYNVTLNRPANAVGAPPPPPAGEDESRLVQLWGTPEEAGRWAVDVMGDTRVQTCQGCTPSTDPGLGLPVKYEQEREEIEPDLIDLVDGVADPTFENLAQVSAPSVRVTPKLIEAMQSIREPQERALAVGRLAADIATARTVERALVVRQMILTGQRVPEVSANDSALEEHVQIIDNLEGEIDRFLYEFRVRQELVSNTALVVLERARIQEIQAIAEQSPTGTDPNQLIRGRVPTN